MRVQLDAINIEFTNICNLSCPMCWSQHPRLYPPRKKGFMSKDLYMKILHELQTDFDPSKVFLGLNYVGESTLHPKFDEYLRELEGIPFGRKQIITNCTLLSDSRRKLLYDLDIDIQISIHVSNFLDQVKETIKKMSLEGHPVDIVVVKEEFKDKELSNIINDTGPYFRQLIVSAYVTEDLHYLQHSWKDKLHISDRRDPCRAPFTYLAVLWDGNVLPCCRFGNSGDFTLGNINNSTVKEVFYGESFEKLRRGDYTSTPCEHCTVAD